VGGSGKEVWRVLVFGTQPAGQAVHAPEEAAYRRRQQATMEEKSSGKKRAGKQGKRIGKPEEEIQKRGRGVIC